MVKAIEALPEAITVEKVITALKWLFALGVIDRANGILNRWALNAWRFSSVKNNWRWYQEVAVVTGGSSGIGEVIVRTLAEKDVKVAVVDIQPLPASLKRCESA